MRGSGKYFCLFPPLPTQWLWLNLACQSTDSRARFFSAPFDVRNFFYPETLFPRGRLQLHDAPLLHAPRELRPAFPSGSCARWPRMRRESHERGFITRSSEMGNAFLMLRMGFAVECGYRTSFVPDNQLSAPANLGRELGVRPLQLLVRTCNICKHSSMAWLSEEPQNPFFFFWPLDTLSPSSTDSW